MATSVPLKELCELITKGTTPTSIGFDFADEGVGFLRVQNISGGTVNFEKDTLFIDEQVHQSLKRSQILPGDVLLSIAGSIGRTGVVPENAPPLNCNQAVAILRTSEKIYCPFLRHWLEGEDAQKQMRGATVTGTIQNLSLTQIGELRIPLPPLPEQRRIAAILDQADALRVKRGETLEHLDSLTQSIFMEMFGDPAENTKGWTSVRLEEVSQVGSSKRVFVEELVDAGIPFYRGTEVGQLGEGLPVEPSLFITQEHFERLKGETGIPTLGDLLLPSICPDGRIFMVQDDKPFYFKDGRVLWINVNKSCVNSVFLRQQLKHLFASNYSKIASGTTFAELKIFALKNLRICLPPHHLQERFSSIVEVIQKQTDSFKIQKNEFDNFFASLQHRAFQGAL